MAESFIPLSSRVMIQHIERSGTWEEKLDLFADQQRWEMSDRMRLLAELLESQCCLLEHRINNNLSKSKFSIAKALEEAREAKGLPRLRLYPIHMSSYTFYQ